MQGSVKEKGCEEGRATWVKRCPSGRLYAHPTTPSPLHTLSPLSLKDRSLNPCARRFHLSIHTLLFTPDRFARLPSPPAHAFHLSLLRIALSKHVHSGFTRSTVSPPISAVSLTSAPAHAFLLLLLRASFSIHVQAVSDGSLRTRSNPAAQI